jgi:hypothetical protein
MTVVVLEDAAEDIEAGMHFYESREAGIAIISWSRSFRTLVHLFRTPAFTPRILVSSGCSQSASRLVSTMRLKARQRMSMRFWTCGAILFGFVANCGRGDSEPAA